MRELDFARVDFYERTGLYKMVRSHGGGIVQGCATIRYRRFIKPFAIFTITTKVIYWDSQGIYLESRFVGKDGFIHAIAICKQRVINCSADEVMEILLKETPTQEMSDQKLENGDLIKLKPEMPPEVSELFHQIYFIRCLRLIYIHQNLSLFKVEKWNESNEISSANLRRI